MYGLLPVPTVKQEEGGEEEGEKNGLEEAGRSVEEASGLDEPSTDSPNNVQDGDPQTVGSCDTGTRLPNGNLAYSTVYVLNGELKPCESHNRWSYNELPVTDLNEPIRLAFHNIILLLILISESLTLYVHSTNICLDLMTVLIALMKLVSINVVLPR